MKPDFTKLNRLIAARPEWKPSDERNDKRRAADTEIGNEVEWIVAQFCMQQGFTAEKITRSGFDKLSYPAGHFMRKDPDDGDLILSHFVSFDLLISGTANFKIEVKLKAAQGHGSGRYYPLDRIRMQRMRKAYGYAPSMPHLFVVLDTTRAEAPAYGLFAASVDQLVANASSYVIQHGFGTANEDAYRIPVSEFRPLTHFLKQHNFAKDTTYAAPQKPLPYADAAA